jgi:hypothetical protein
MDIDTKFRSLLDAVLMRCRKMRGKDRRQVARELAEILGRLDSPLKRVVTESMLNEFTRSIQPGRESHFPAAWLRSFCEVTADDELARFVLPEHLRGALALGEAVLESDSSLRRAVEELGKLQRSNRRK